MQKLNRKKRKFIKLLNIFPIVGIIIISIVFIFVLFVVINGYYEKEEKQYEKTIYTQTISKAKHELNSLYSLIDFLYQKKERHLKRDLVQNVNIGYSILESLYKNSVDFKIIKNTLENIRFFSDKSGYFFIYDLKGNVLSVPIKKSLEGKNLYNYKDIKGNYIIKDMITYLKKKNEGFFTWYYIYPHTKEIEKKIGFVKLFKPLNIFIGSAFYESTINKEVKNEIKELFPKITKDLPYKVITYDTKGNIIFSNKDFSNKYIKLLETKNNKIYTFNTTIDKNTISLFLKYYPKLDIYLGVIVNKSKIKEQIIKNREKIDEIIKKIITQFLVVAFVFILLALTLNIFMVKLLQSLFLNYEKELITQKEKAEESEKAKAQFLANMSHEIRTPLNAMFGFIKILQEKNLDKESKKYLNIIEKSGENLLTIINDILDFSKLESGKMKIEKIEFNPKEEIEVIQNLFASKASEKDIILKFNTKNLKWCIISDPTRIKQVIANLLSNAIKFTPKHKKITLNVKYDDKKEELFVEVIDEGIGIPKEKLKNIFEAFTQADTSTTRKYGGTGLGLTISSKLIKLLGGELKVESEVNKGSRFYFTIPAKKTKLIPKKEKTETKKILDEKFDKYVLVVEDNPANQMFISVVLNKLGIKFDIAKDGIEAIEKFKQNRYDVILMDENMPNMNGIEATKKIREIEKEKNLKHTIIVALTANALSGDKDKFLKAGMDFYLSKPLDIEKLKEIFRKIK